MAGFENRLRVLQHRGGSSSGACWCCVHNFWFNLYVVLAAIAAGRRVG
jgi:hypothetical protein